MQLLNGRMSRPRGLRGATCRKGWSHCPPLRHRNLGARNTDLKNPAESHTVTNRLYRQCNSYLLCNNHGRNISVFKCRSGKQADTEVAKQEAALLPLYVEYLLACLTERTWRFAVPLILSTRQDSMSIVAIVGFVGQLACFLLGPIIGNVLDNLPRYRGLITFTVVQALAISLQSVLLWGLTSKPSPPAFLLDPFFLGLCFVQVLDRLAALATDVSVERDWIVRLVGRKRPIALAKANSTLRRIDLFSEFVGPLMIGTSIAAAKCSSVLPVVALMVISAVPIKVALLKNVVKEGGAVLEKYEAPLNVLQTAKHDDKNLIQAIIDTWKLYLRQPICATSVALIFLFCNAVLTPGGVMTVVLTQQGIDGRGVAVFRTACAAIGFFSTVLLAPMIKKFGLIGAGAFSLLIMNLCLIPAAVIYNTCLVGERVGHAVCQGLNAPLWIFCGAIAFSRFGLWAYDMLESQMFQMLVPSAEASTVSSVELALCSLGELLMLGLVAVLSGHFTELVWVSAGFVFLALIVYLIWMFRGAERENPQIGRRGSLSAAI